MDRGVEALGVDFLHELEAGEGRVGDGCPPYGAGVVDEDVDAGVEGDGLGDQVLDAGGGAGVYCDGGGGSAEVGDFEGDGVDGGGGGVGVGGKGDAGVRVGGGFGGYDN